MSFSPLVIPLTALFLVYQVFFLSLSLKRFSMSISPYLQLNLEIAIFSQLLAPEPTKSLLTYWTSALGYLTGKLTLRSSKPLSSCPLSSDLRFLLQLVLYKLSRTPAKGLKPDNLSAALSYSLAMLTFCSSPSLANPSQLPLPWSRWETPQPHCLCSSQTCLCLCLCPSHISSNVPTRLSFFQITSIFINSLILGIWYLPTTSIFVVNSHGI